ANFGGKPVTLKSDSTGTASIGQITGTLSDATNVTVERYIPGITSPATTNSFGRRWRFVSSSLQNSTLQDLRQEMFITGPGTGTTLGTVNSNGFDATYNNSPSVFRYNEADTGRSSNGWVSINHIDSVLVPGIGYRVFVRGDRSDTTRLVANSTTPQNTFTLDFRGTPNQGNISIPLSFTNSSSTGDGWNLVGNPYPSSIDWNAIHDPGRTASGSGFSGTDYTQLYHSVYVYNPVTNVYNSYNALSNTGTGSLTSGIIASGQAFFVKATADNPTLMLRESHKANSTKGLFKTINNSACYIQLIRDSFNRDEMCIKYLDGSSTNEDSYDTRLLSASVNVSAWGSDSVDLTISCRPTTTINDTIRLNVAVPGSGNYTLRFNNSSTLAIQDHVTLIDAYASTTTNLIAQPNYTFSVNTAVPQTFGRGRFYIVVSNSTPVSAESVTRKVSVAEVFPNPNTGQFTLRTDVPGSYILFDINGKEVESGRYSKEHTFSQIRSGVYTLKLQVDDGSVQQVKVVVAK
ncbi:MAG: T9SS type A sorting domain-containing protein, partial [Bacteroidota bacterium]